NINTKLSWKNGKFKVVQKVKGSGSISEPHITTFVNNLIPVHSKSIKVDNKTHTIQVLPCGIAAENSGSGFYEVVAGILPDVKTAMIEEQKGKTGEMIVT